VRILHAWQVTKDPAFKRIAEETLDFVAREMTHEQGGFYSSLDADSEGVEGKFYVWSLDEIRNILKEDSVFFEAAYGIITDGNWEGKTVLHREWMIQPLLHASKLIWMMSLKNWQNLIPNF
jgi:uncharacterized protein YyaL (SSP411 family)